MAKKRKERHKRLTPPADLQESMDRGDWRSVLAHKTRVVIKADRMSRSGHPDAEAREASANYTDQLVSNWLEPHLDTGVKVRRGGKKGATKRTENRDATWDERAFLEWYA